MKIVLRILLLVIFPLRTISCGEPTSGYEDLSGSPTKVIIDTDLDSDVDDVGALSMLLNLHKAGSIDLIGVIVTSDDPFAPVCASSINTFYGFPEIPIGFIKDQSALTNFSRYTRQIASEFPSGLKKWQDAEDGTALYRKLLDQSPDGSVIIVTIGHLTSLQRLLQSQTDPISQSSGQKLVQEKVKNWICMGGQFPKGKEANFYRPDPQSTVYCVENWQREVVFCGWEAGNKIITGGSSLKEKLKSDHPVYRAYELYNNFAGRPSWEQIAVLLLTHQSKNMFSYISGNCIVSQDGSNGWKNDENGKHKYVVLNPSIENVQVCNSIDSLMAGLAALEIK
jgi:inosine-uridine nucleoside N-ribohydrolase